MACGRKGGGTRDFTTGEITPLYYAAENYAASDTPAAVLAGKMYGSGSSRDWAAKGPMLLGVRVAIAESFERIHRSNLVQMGMLPLEFAEGEGASSLGLDGTEVYEIDAVDLSSGLPASRTVNVRATKQDGTVVEFSCVVRVDTALEGRFLASGGILPYVLEELS